MKLKNLGLALIATITMGLTTTTTVDAASFRDYFTQEQMDKADEVVKEGKEVSKSLLSKLADKINEKIGTENEVGTVETTDIELEFQSGSNIVTDLGQSTLDSSTWTSSHIEYGNLDNLNRATTATAYLQKSNVGPSDGRGGQSWQPTGWNNQKIKVNGKKRTVQDRGHLIAYTLSFNLDDNGNYVNGLEGSEDNPLNLTTQSSYSNRGQFQTYEEIVRKGLKSGKEIIYQVSPLYKDNELMPRAYQMQAVSTDETINFNVVVYNVQPGVEFNYETGRPSPNSDMLVNK